MRVWLAEFIGTFALVLAGVSALAAGASPLGVALAFGFAVAVMIAAVGPISAAHFNPAVTLGFWLLGRIGLTQLFSYWSAELAGALSAVLVLRSWYGVEKLAAAGFGATGLAPGLGPWTGVGVEAVLTFLLMFVIACVAAQQHALAGLYIGLTVSLGALAGGALTGASMNPARSFAPALLGGIWRDQWVYWLGPLLGAGAAALAVHFLWRQAPSPLVQAAAARAQGRKA